MPLEGFKTPRIDQVEISSLKKFKVNSRIHSADQIAQIAASISEFGFINPIIADHGTKEIIAGHGRLAAAEKLRIEMVPVIFISHLSENQRRALVIADNRIAENASWDENILASELQSLELGDFVIELTGFNIDDLDEMLGEDFGGELGPTGPGENSDSEKQSDPKEGSKNNDPKEVDLNSDDIDESDVEEIQDEGIKPVSIPGNVWYLGSHELVCSDLNLLECDYIIRSWQKAFGKDAILEESKDKTFNQIESERE